MARGAKSFTVKSGSVSVPVYHSISPQGYHSFCVTWNIGAKRQRRRFSDASEARAFAQDIADRVSNGRTEDHTLTQAEADEFREAKLILKDLSLIDAARHYVAHRLAADTCPSLLVAGRAFVAWKRDLPRRRPLHAEYLRGVSQRLDTIAEVEKSNKTAQFKIPTQIRNLQRAPLFQPKSTVALFWGLIGDK